MKAYCEGCEYDLVNEMIPKYVDTIYGIAMEIRKEADDHSRLLSMLNKYYRLKHVMENDYIMIAQLSRNLI